MEFIEGSVVETRNGNFPLKVAKKTYDTSTLEPIWNFVVNDNGIERVICEKEVIAITTNEKNRSFLVKLITFGKKLKKYVS